MLLVHMEMLIYNIYYIPCLDKVKRYRCLKNKHFKHVVTALHSKLTSFVAKLYVSSKSNKQFQSSN